MARSELARDTECGRHVDAGCRAEEEALVVQQTVDATHRVRVLDQHGVIDGRTLEIRSYAADTDALGDRTAPRGRERATAYVGIQAAARWIGEHAADRAPA